MNHVGLVVNFELPDSAHWLTHRIGRTARMGEAGRALTFVTPEDEVAWVSSAARARLTSVRSTPTGFWRKAAGNTGSAAGRFSRRIAPPSRQP